MGWPERRGGDLYKATHPNSCSGGALKLLIKIRKWEGRKFINILALPTIVVKVSNKRLHSWPGTKFIVNLISRTKVWQTSSTDSYRLIDWLIMSYTDPAVRRTAMPGWSSFGASCRSESNRVWQTHFTSSLLEWPATSSTERSGSYLRLYTVSGHCYLSHALFTPKLYVFTL